MPKKKPDSEKAKKVSVSIPRADWELVELRLLDWRCGPSEYIQRLIRDDTQQLWMARNTAPIMPLPIAAETTEAGPELSQDKSKGKYQTAAANKAAKAAGAKIAKLSANLGSGSSTATTANSQQAG